MADDTAPADDESTLTDDLDDLLTDFGAYIGEPSQRQRLIRKLVHGLQVTADDLDTLRWYFHHVEPDMRSMGGFVVSKLKDTESARDTLKGARRLRERTEKKPKRHGENMHYAPPLPESMSAEDRREDWEVGVYYWFTYDSPDKSRAHPQNLETTAEHFGITPGQVQRILDERTEKQAGGHDED